MQTISKDVVEAVWDEVMSTPPEQAEAMFQKVLKQQPAISIYLLALDEDLLPPEEHGLLMMIGYCVIRVMSKGASPLRQVSPEELEEAEQLNFTALESLEEGSEADFAGTVSVLTQSYNQAPLLGVVLEALMEGDEEEPDHAPENIGLLFFHLKSVIDCLDR